GGGESSSGSEGVMRESEGRGINYLFKLRLTKNVKSLIERAFMKGGWSDAGQGWQGKAETLRLVGWSRHRRVIVLRRRLKEGVVADVREGPNQLRLSFAELEDDTQLYEYAVLVTSLEAEVLTIAQLYRDRADCENAFDELKNQWGWGGFTTHDLARCRLTACMVSARLQLVEYLRAPGRARQASGGDHQPSAPARRHRRAYTPR